MSMNKETVPVNETEYQTSIHVGQHFTAKDITVNLDVNNENDLNSFISTANKLTVHCLKSEPLNTSAVTNSFMQSLLDSNNAETARYGTTSCLRKELKREIVLPSNADINTLESYLDEGFLYFTCKLVKDLKKSISSSSFTSITPNNHTLSSRYLFEV